MDRDDDDDENQKAALNADHVITKVKVEWKVLTVVAVKLRQRTRKINAGLDCRVVLKTALPSVLTSGEAEH